MKPTRNNRGVTHENGAKEIAHGQLKWSIADALLPRGSKDFDGLGDYRRWLAEIVGRISARRRQVI